MEDFRSQLEELNPYVTLSVELPHNGNGNLYQARTTTDDGLIFYGRASNEEEAIAKCCQKAVKHLNKIQEQPTTRPPSRNASSTSKRNPKPARNPVQAEPSRPPRRSNECSKREQELRCEMGDVLDRVAQWSSKYDQPSKRYLPFFSRFASRWLALADDGSLVNTSNLIFQESRK